MFSVRVPNESGIKNARLGRFSNGSKSFIFTHRNPKNGMMWCEDAPVFDLTSEREVFGMWMPADWVVFKRKKELKI